MSQFIGSIHWIEYIIHIQWRWKPMNKEYVGRRCVLAGSAHALTCFLVISASDAYSLFTDRLKHIAHKNARASKIICFNLIGLITHLLGLFWVYQSAWKRSCVYKMIQCFFSEGFWHGTNYWFANQSSVLKASNHIFTKYFHLQIEEWLIIL